MPIFRFVPGEPVAKRSAQTTSAGKNEQRSNIAAIKVRGFVNFVSQKFFTFYSMHPNVIFGVLVSCSGFFFYEFCFDVWCYLQW